MLVAMSEEWGIFTALRWSPAPFQDPRNPSKIIPSAIAKSNSLGKFYQVAVKFSPKNTVIILPVPGEYQDSPEKYMPETVAATHTHGRTKVDPV